MEVFFEQTRKLLHKLTELSCCFRGWKGIGAYKTAREAVLMLQEYVEGLEKNGFDCEAEGIRPILQRISDVIKSKDMEQILELCQKELTPRLYKLQRDVFGQADGILKDCWEINRLILRKKDKDLYRMILSAREHISDDYQLGWARTGDLLLTVETEQGAVRLNSSGDPWQEALLFVAGELEKDYKECVVFGFGMGYHVEALAKISNAKKIVVLEYDLTQLAIALSYRDLSGILADSRVSVLYYPECKRYIDWLNTRENRLISFWYPSIKSIRGREFREILENYQIEHASIKYFGNTLEENFKSNIKKGDEEASILRDSLYQKTMVFAAGGSSLENTLEELRHLNRSKYALICVGTVAGKLIEQEIYPDYIVITDPQTKTVDQIRGIENCMVPLIYLSTVAADVVENYQGKRYIAFQEGFQTAEKYAAGKGYSLYQSGGSVSTFAIDMGIRMGCSCIICIGLDLAYLDERSHAFGIGDAVIDNKNLRQVEGITSNYVYTSKTLDIYRRWIEKRIRREKEIKFINASKGARIHGMEERDLEDCFSI